MTRPHLRPVTWKNGSLRLLDQRKLPNQERILTLRSVPQVIDAIRTMAVRGAPLIGVTAAYGMVLAARTSKSRRELNKAAGKLKESRPTAVNLAWAVERVLHAVAPDFDELSPRERERRALREARRIHREDEDLCERIGRHGARLVPRKGRILTVCNTGALATAGIGTAFGVFVKARPKDPTVYALETRPRLQGARLTMYELRKARLDGVLLCDSAAAPVLQSGGIDLIVTGADRIAANGDTANKIGTYNLALLAKAHGVPFYVAAPYSTFDLSVRSGREIPIEQRSPHEVLGPVGLEGRRIRALNPAFDVTPARLIDGFITDRGLLRPPYRKSIRRAFGRAKRR